MPDTSPPDTPLWTPSPERIAASALTRFRETVNRDEHLALATSRELHHWSCAAPGRFWSAVWDFCGIIGAKGATTLADAGRMPGARFFPDATLNFAENLLSRNDASTALVFRGEDQVEKRWSWRVLHETVSRLQQALRAEGVAAGDRVAAMMPNMPETIAVMLAAASIGAVFSSCSPDFGERGVLDRFGQIEPKILVVCDGYHYAGKRLALAEKLLPIARQLPSLRRVVVVDYIGEAEATVKTIAGAVTFDRFLSDHDARPVQFLPLPFAHPLYILFSSGTTGVPKCIAHSAGGTLIQHVKEHRLHCDIRDGDRVFYFSTCGWMMWNWLVSALASRATLLLFDGSPFHPAPSVLFDFADAEGMTFFGTSAKYIDACRKAGLRPAETHLLSDLRAIASTGSPLAPEGFDYIYRDVRADVHLASVSGGTDIVSCFVLGDPTAPVYRGEIQMPGLGLDVDVFDENGASIRETKGELVCKQPFPSMPIGFWKDADGQRYHDAYFARFANVWCHGDFAEWTRHGGLIIHGRSDATLNPGGVRIGTAELYAQVERIPEVLEAVAIGQDFQNDVRIILFVRLAADVSLDDALVARIKREIRNGASPRHVPAKIVAVADIPRTKSGKITELAVRDVVLGREVKNKEALANPQALDLFRNLPELAR